jgi:hypothetical protein
MYAVNEATKLNALEWNEPRVDKWLREANIHHTIRENVAPGDGNTLKELHTIMNSAPEFFFKSVVRSSTAESSSEPPRLKDVAKFSHELRALFKNLTI